MSSRQLCRAVCDLDADQVVCDAVVVASAAAVTCSVREHSDDFILDFRIDRDSSKVEHSDR